MRQVENKILTLELDFRQNHIENEQILLIALQNRQILQKNAASLGSVLLEERQARSLGTIYCNPQAPVWSALSSQWPAGSGCAFNASAYFQELQSQFQSVVQDVNVSGVTIPTLSRPHRPNNQGQFKKIKDAKSSPKQSNLMKKMCLKLRCTGAPVHRCTGCCGALVHQCTGQYGPLVHWYTF